MKKLFIVVYLLLSGFYTFANKVDEIKTDSDVIKFMQPLQESFNYKGAPKLVIHSSEELVKRHGCDSLVGTWNIKNWVKVDFNNDHKTDLLAIMEWYYNDHNYIAIDKGDDTFQLIQIGGDDLGRCQLANAIKYRDDQVVLLHSWGAADFWHLHNKWISRTDTLTYKYGNFVEYNKTPSHYKIDSISFSIEWGWFGRENTPPKIPHPDRTIVMDYSGNTVLTNYKDFVYYILKKGQTMPHDPKTTVGTFKTKISQANLQEIYDLIDYLSIKKLNERYTVHITDLESNYLRIKFKDGSVKYIADYGGSGNFGLRNLFLKFYALPGNQNWK